MWDAERELFGRAFRVITPDLPGFGRSPRQPTPSVPKMAQAVAEQLDGLGVTEPVAIGGLSMGGYVTFEFLRQFPDRVRGLGLFSTRAVPDTAEGREARLKTAQKIRAEGLGAFSKAVLSKLLGKHTLESKPEVARGVTEMIRYTPPEGVADALLAMAGRRDSTDLLGKIRCPTLVVAGDEDSFIPVSEAEAMASAIPRARFAVIRRAGHLVNLEQPELFQSILGRFLIEQRSEHRWTGK